ncbi:MAG: HPr family phosphocarrier protein [Chitinivibrionales bacterium]|nr:HPr family phosphocarrier protein [Chitinivibrionales bacterium]
MIERTITVTNPKGVHARPAALIAKTAMHYESSILLKKDDVVANARQIIEILMLCAPCGSHIVVEIDGADEEQALQSLEEVFQTHFGEED